MGTVQAVESFHSDYGHYFLTISALEISSLDGNARPGWRRTGESFEVWYFAATNLVPMCRFWSNQSFAPKSSHFYTAYPHRTTATRPILWCWKR